MTMGCRIPNAYKHILKQHSAACGLMDEGQQQMNKALYGPNGYRNGEPYHFGSLGLHATMASKPTPEDKTGKNKVIGFNVPGTGTMFWPGPGAKQAAVPGVNDGSGGGKTPGKQCGFCGATKAETSAELMTCSKCKKVSYCSKDCQKCHWAAHKKACEAPET